MKLWRHWRFGVILVVMVLVMGMRVEEGAIEQDHYLEYAEGIKNGTLLQMPQADYRLMPGLPWLIAATHVVGGYLGGGVGGERPSLLDDTSWRVGGEMLVLAAVVGMYMGLFALTGSYWSFVPLVFPPIMLSAGTIVGTDMMVGALVVAALVMLMRNDMILMGLMVGLGLWMRPVMGIVAVLMGGYLLYKSRYKDALVYGLMAFMLGTAVLLWNGFVFGDAGVQLTHYVSYGRATVGVWQLIQDIPRAIDWGWWRQVVSGGAYLVLLGGWVWLAFQEKQRGDLRKIEGVMKLLVIGLIGFVFLLGPTPFLEEFPRFLVPVFPLMWLLTYKRWQRWWVWGLVAVSMVVVLV